MLVFRVKNLSYYVLKQPGQFLATIFATVVSPVEFLITIHVCGSSRRVIIHVIIHIIWHTTGRESPNIL